MRSEGGSGGTEAIVRGTLHGRDAAWVVRCHAQAEALEPEAACLQLIETLTPAAQAR